jgi:uncharacterized protein YbaR (Trm112 family)
MKTLCCPECGREPINIYQRRLDTPLDLDRHSYIELVCEECDHVFTAKEIIDGMLYIDLDYSEGKSPAWIIIQIANYEEYRKKQEE